MAEIDDDFERRDQAGGRRAYDAPTVPLREHLETLIRGVRTELHLEVTGVAAKVDELKAENVTAHTEVKEALAELTRAVGVLETDRDERQGEGRAKTRIWALVVGAAAVAGSVSGVVVAIVNAGAG